MPYVEVSLAGSATDEQKKQIASEITSTLEKVVGKPPSATYVVINEVSRKNWAVGGKMLDGE